MIKYDTKSWSGVIFSYKGTSLRTILPRLTFIVYWALALEAYSLYVTKLPKIEPLGHNLLGMALGLLLVFRNNSSYDRYWEGRKAWGAIINACRNMSRLGAMYTTSGADLAKLISAYVRALKNHLRGEYSEEELAKYMSAEKLAQISKSDNVPVSLGFWLSSWVHEQKIKGLPINHVVVMEAQVSEMLNNQGVCERILNTPIPFCHAAHISQLLFIYLMTLPIVLISVAGWMGVVASGIISFGLMGIESAGVEIEDPFGTDPNDLPLDDFCDTIERDANFFAGMTENIHR